MTLTRKLIIPTIILFFFMLAGLFAYFFTSLHDATHEAEEGDLASFQASFSAEVENQKQLALALASEAAGNPAIQDALARKDVKRLRELAQPSYELLKETNGNIILNQYHLADGTLFLNADDPAESGESQMTLSPAVLLANSIQMPVAGLEAENGRLGTRGIVPIYFQGKHIGSVEFGVGFNQNLLVGLKAKFGGEWQILLIKDILPDVAPSVASPNNDLMVFATTQDSALFNDPASYIKALNGESTITHPSVDRRDYAVLSAPVYDYSENIIGVLDIVYDHTHISSAQNTRLLIAGLASLGVLALGILGLVFLTRRTLQPIQTLTKKAAEIADGNMSSYINIEAGSDEFGVLANTFNLMTSQIKDMVNTLEDRVKQRTVQVEQVSLISEKRAKEFQAISETARIISTEKDLEKLLTLVTNIISERFDFYHVGVFLLDENRKFAVLRASNSPGGKIMLRRQHKLEIGLVGIVGNVTHTGIPRIALDTGADAVYFNNPDLPETRSEMALPLTVRGDVIGALDVQSTEQNAFAESDVSGISLLADQVAIAIDNTLLLEETQSALAESQAVFREYLAEAWKRKSSSDALGYYQTIAGGQLITSEEGLDQDLRSTDQAGGSNLNIPIRIRDQVIGTLNIRPSDGNKHWKKEDVAMIEAVSERLGLALDNARLFEETSLRAMRERTVTDITTKIRETNDPQEMISTAIEELQRVLGVARIEIVPQKLTLPPDR